MARPRWPGLSLWGERRAAGIPFGAQAIDPPFPVAHAESENTVDLQGKFVALQSAA